METPDFTRFAEAHRAYAESLFAKIRSLSASPAPNRGVTRFGYSEVEDRVLDALEEEGRALGLETSRDAAGNLLMRLPGCDRTLPGLFCGSHADSVLDGGNFDGLAGITAALLVVRDLQARGVTPARDIVVTALRCEEQGLIGSRAMMGKLSEADLGRRWTPDSPTLAERLTAQGYDVARLSSGTPVVDPKSIAAFLELHIEQGVRLTQPGGPRVGLVTGIRGMVYHRMIHCWGEPAHAGAIDFPFRHDALAATTRLVAGAWERWSQRVAKGEDLVFTTGILETDPTAIFNKVPEHVRFSLDARSLSSETREGFIYDFYEDAKRLEAFHGVRFEFDPAGRNEPMESDPELMAKLEEGAAALGIPVIHEPSGAGHDAQTFGLEKIPFAMVFIANANGSHNPDEAVETDDFLAGAAVLTEAVRLYTA